MVPPKTHDAIPITPSVCIDWYAEGQTRVIEVDGVRVTVRYVGRKGRRARIAIEARRGGVWPCGFAAAGDRVTALREH